MRISVITAVRNKIDTIAETLASIREQTHPDIEHIVIDGASTDGTVELIDRNCDRVAQFVSEPDRGPYDGMNKGLDLATGDVVGFLNGDDVFTAPTVVSRVAKVHDSDEIDGCYANLIYVARNDPARIIRRWNSQPYRPGLFETGWMPAHPTFYLKRRVYEKFGGFDLQFPLQADFDFAMRVIAVHGIRTVFVPEVWVRMRRGGLSNSLMNVLKGNLEAYAICRKNGLAVPPWFPVRKVLSRIPQFLPRR
jgi:glycosyltransferase involved in cell wall biosynthesis